jgi:HlyD family secretion protein
MTDTSISDRSTPLAATANARRAAAAEEEHGAQSPPSSRRRMILVVLFVAAAIGAGLWLAFRHEDDLVQGMADADNINVAAKITARVASLRVREGDRVSAGQALFELTSPEASARRRQATAALDGARALQSKALEGARTEEIRAALANWRRAVAAAELAQSTLRRISALFEQNVVTRQRQEEAQAQANSAAEAAAAARAQYDEALAGARQQDRQAAGAQVRQAEGAVAEAEAAYDEVVGRAPSAGEVEKKLADVGELVPAGYPVFTLVALDEMWVALFLREDEFRGMRIGRTLVGDIPALGIAHAQFRVYYVSPAGDFATWRATRQSAGYDVKTFEIRARPVQPIADFRPGMSVLFRWPQP